MMGILGKKLGMTTVFVDNGTAVPVTVLEAGPCLITQIKDVPSDGYKALQLGYGDIKDKHLAKPMAGHFKKQNVKAQRYLREFKIDDVAKYAIGQEIKVDIFSKGDYIDVTAITKGKGFQGVMRRHGMSGGPESHGSNFHRRPGSIGQRTFPGRVFKNHHHPGHMGSTKVTIQHLKVIDIKIDDNLIIVCGAIPGARNTIVKLTSSTKQKKTVKA
ncbi:MAG: 50S ribosomal protein L3 [Spirochaetes bacterium]|nr:50S ribosomal protein L3 [Spirochaetota bacterium]